MQIFKVTTDPEEHIILEDNAAHTNRDQLFGLQSAEFLSVPVVVQQANSEPQHSDIDSVESDAHSNNSYQRVKKDKVSRSFRALTRGASGRAL